MVALKAGRVGDIDDSMAGDIDAEMIAEWNRLKDVPMPDDPAVVQDRQIIFVAIARGVLGYLQRQQGEIATTEHPADGSGPAHSHQLSFEWE